MIRGLKPQERLKVIKEGIEYDFEVAEEGDYVVTVPLYPSCVSQGETSEEALGNIEDALLGCLAAARVRKKYKQVLVDIEELPEIKPGETVIPLGSLDDLVRISDDLLKPVLHQASEGRHVYCTIDGSVRYQYISQS